MATQRETGIDLKDSDGNSLRTVSRELDYPLPPALELKELHSFRPGLVDKAFAIAEQEAFASLRHLL